uniref:Secreted protein n=1 Tax=Parastrongyloides trichosuri TaxID=131310 RepID=A0A0N4ZJD0_PARTI
MKIFITYINFILISVSLLVDSCTIPAGSKLLQNPTFKAYVFLPKSWTWDTTSSSPSVGIRKKFSLIGGTGSQQTSPEAVITTIDGDIRSVVKDVVKNMGLNFFGANFSLTTPASQIPQMPLITIDQVIDYCLSTQVTNKAIDNNLVEEPTTETPTSKPFTCTECYVMEENSVKYIIKDITKIQCADIFDTTSGMVPYSQLLTFKTENTPLYYDFYWDILGDRIRTALQKEGIIFDSPMESSPST